MELTLKFGHPQNFFPAFLVVLAVLMTTTSPHWQIRVKSNPFHPPLVEEKPPFALLEHVQEQQELAWDMLQNTTKSPQYTCRISQEFHNSNEKKGKGKENLLNMEPIQQFRVSLQLMPHQFHPF